MRGPPSAWRRLGPRYAVQAGEMDRGFRPEAITQLRVRIRSLERQVRSAMILSFSTGSLPNVQDQQTSVINSNRVFEEQTESLAITANECPGGHHREHSVTAIGRE